MSILRQFEIEPTMANFTIYGKFPTINEYIKALNNNRYVGANLKRDCEESAMWSMSGIKHLRFDKVILHYRFFEPNQKRDKDNVFAFTTKVVQDAMQELGMIDNDGWKNIENFTHDFFVDKDNPRIEVYIEEVGKGKE